MRYDLKILEYDKILAMLKDKAQTNDGKAAISKLKPLKNEQKLNEAFHELSEAFQYVQDDSTPAFGGIHSLDEALNRARIQAQIDTDDFMRIAAHIDAAKRMKRDLRRFPESIDATFEIEAHGDALIVLHELKAEIDRIFDARGNIRDDASDTLRRIRIERNQTDRKIKETLENILNKESKKLTEKLFTIRYDRYVIPVRLSDKNNVKGAILDYSSSGETVFIEPESIQKLTAKKLRLENDEVKEIERLLLALSYEVAKHIEPLKANTKIFTHLDTVFAKAKFGYDIEGTIPIIGSTVNFIKARHPLIPKKEVVANTITFDEDKRMMVITGSNTGGKTVTLKTIGLLTLMAQSAMMIPALKGSEFRIFNSIRADIGDEQSIEQSLSTFSSHMKRIVDIIEHYDDNHLILLDELGSGTDPKEGSSLAMSILSHLSTKNSMVVATTHYPELKAYAYTEDFIMNASVEFDETSLKPTYKLLLRTPGESHAFLISSRLGLEDSVIENAKNMVLTQKSEVSELIDKLKKESKRLEETLSDYEKKNHELQTETDALKAEKKRLQNEREKLKEKVMLETNKELAQLRMQAETLISELEAMKTKSFKAHELAEKKHQAKSLQPEAKTQSSKTKDHTYKVGDKVYILKYNRYGELAKKQKGKQWLINMGTLSSVFHEDAFEYAEQPKQEKQTEKTTTKTPRKTTQSTLDLRGMRVHEAEEALEKYLDDCALSKQPYATIIHGFGTLALRKMVKDKVAQSPHVVRHRDGEGSEGGQGATIVYFTE